MDATECVGQFDMRVEAAEPASQTLERWNRRAEALAAWLLAEWQREQKEAA
jgi:hypothetical protein